MTTGRTGKLTDLVDDSLYGVKLDLSLVAKGVEISCCLRVYVSVGFKIKAKWCLTWHLIDTVLYWPGNFVYNKYY